jgi:hypothetical protein
MGFIKLEAVGLSSANLTEKQVQEQIAADPSILGLGDLELREKERIQSGAGRLDLLLQDPETLKRYEVEIPQGGPCAVVQFQRRLLADQDRRRQFDEGRATRRRWVGYALSPLLQAVVIEAECRGGATDAMRLTRLTVSAHNVCGIRPAVRRARHA